MRSNGVTDLTWVLLDDFNSNAIGFGDAFMVVAAVGSDVLNEGEEPGARPLYSGAYPQDLK
ncbi:hypothetical protein CQ054_10560 [Ochrobactrum sp. MYb29]|nr:hypothetical protein CQ054_10560 [Ochrobactrum sp. MYb29]